MKIPESGTMEDGPNSAPHNGQLGPSGVGTSSSSVKVNNGDDNNPRTQYSIPGILHFIQHEWARFEMERSQWEVERAELQVTIIIETIWPFNLSLSHSVLFYLANVFPFFQTQIR